MSEFYSLIALIGSVQGVTLAWIIYSLRVGNRVANYFLITFLLVASLRLFLLWALHSGKFVAFQEIYVLLAVGFSLGPLLYLYIKALSSEFFRWNKRWLWHFAPTVAVVGMGLIAMMSTSDRHTVDVLNWLNRGEETRMFFSLDWWLPLLATLVLMIYSTMGGVLLFRHDFNIHRLLSDHENKSLSWLWGVVCLCFLTSLLELAVHALQYIGFPVGPRFNVALILNVAIVFLISIRGLQQPVVFRGVREEVPDKVLDQVEEEPADSVSENNGQTSNTETKEKAKYERSGLSEEDALILWGRLQDVMQKDKPYLSCTLNLKELSSRLQVSHNHLTEVINTHSKMNFFEYVNGFRVEYAKILLLSPDTDSMLDVALNSGFSSQSAFSTRFKKSTGFSPSQFKRRQGNKIKS